MMWNKCIRCNVYYDQLNPRDNANLCPDCWIALPHYKTEYPPRKGPTYNKTEWKEIILLTIGNLLCAGVIIYYLWS